jgi:signal transduction histidine kinase
LAAAGHDLKQPLFVISMALEQAGATADERLRNSLDRADRALDVLTRAFDALLQSARVESGVLAPRVETVQMIPILDDLRDEWLPRAREKRLDLRVIETRLAVRTDPDMLRTILRNLIGNAIKYTDEGGVIIGCRRRGRSVMLQVTDSGIGIDEAALPSIFDEFRQIEPGARAGLGLGLSIVRGTAEALGHRLIVRSRLGKGSSFGVIVPAADGPTEAD